jgi:hypothetical protein
VFDLLKSSAFTGRAINFFWFGSFHATQIVNYSDGGTMGWFIITLTSSEFLSAAIKRPCSRRLSV